MPLVSRWRRRPIQSGQQQSALPPFNQIAFRSGNIPFHPLLLAHGLLGTRRPNVGGLIYLIGLIVVILFILSFLGLR